MIGQSAPDVPGCISTSEGGLLAHRLVAAHHIPVFTFGHSTLIDLLSWTVALALGAKIVATLILLTAGKDVRDQPGWGSFLWWVTKVAPVIAVPCAIWIAWDQQLTDLLWVFLALMLFVIIAVPLKIRQRRKRLANQTAASSIA